MTKKELARELAVKMRDYKKTMAKMFGGDGEFDIEKAAISFEKYRTKRELEIALKAFED